MKLNNRGFAISGVLYSILILFLVLLLGILSVMASAKFSFDRIKSDIVLDLTGGSKAMINLDSDYYVVNQGYALNMLEGVEFVDESGNVQNDQTITYTVSPSYNKNQIGTYTVTYKTTYKKRDLSATRTVEVKQIDATTFAYTGSPQTFTTSENGIYQIELWGAQGGTPIYDHVGVGGKGAYTSGSLWLGKNTTLYVYVGGMGKGITGGYNGGGSHTSDDSRSGSGGGATDVRLINGAWDAVKGLRSRIMVAAGGGGGGYFEDETDSTGAPGGTLTALFDNKDLFGSGGTQISGGLMGKNYTHNPGASAGSFGKGGSSSMYVCGGGGGGYYGGGGGTHVTPVSSGPGGGGSSYISGHIGCIAVKSQDDSTPKVTSYGSLTDSIHYSGYVFRNTKMIAGNESMPSYDGTSTMVGNSQDGYAKISLMVLKK